VRDNASVTKVERTSYNAIFKEILIKIIHEIFMIMIKHTHTHKQTNKHTWKLSLVAVSVVLTQDRLLPTLILSKLS